MLYDLQSDDLCALIVQIVGGFVPRLLVADVNRDVAGLSYYSDGNRAAVAIAPPPTLVPLGFKLGPLALHGGLDLEEEREPCFHTIVRNDLNQV